MKHDQTLAELKDLALRVFGSNFRPYFSFYESAVRSEVVLDILRRVFAQLVPDVEQKHNCRLAIVCFGSLARFEFVPGFSDLDMLILYSPVQGEAVDADGIRRDVLVSLAQHNPWLELDDRSSIVDARWQDISNLELKYPVIPEAAFVSENDPLLARRRWQVRLESRCLYGDELYEHLYEAIIPH